MKSSFEHLMDIVYRYFPKGRIASIATEGGEDAWPQLVNPPGISPPDFPQKAWPPFGYAETIEHHRLVEARKNAAAHQDAWLQALREISLRFPALVVQNNAVHLAGGSFDSGYSGTLELPDSDSDDSGHRIHELRFAVSFLAPYYTYSYSTRTYSSESRLRAPNDDWERDDCEENATSEGDEVVYVAEGELSIPSLPEYEQSFHLPQAAQPFAEAIASILRASFPGYEYLPPETGTIVLPDVVTDFKFFGEVTLYECLFTSNW